MKILIIDDRINRQQNFLVENNISSNILKSIDNDVVNLQGDAFEQMKYELVNRNYDILNPYSCLIVHRSAFSKDIINALYEKCKKHNIKLVFFSGGISSTTLQDDGKFSFLTINSKNLYSLNLELFLSEVKNKGVANLGVLAFGKDYELNLLLSLLQRLCFSDGIKLLSTICIVEEIVEKYQITNEFLLHAMFERMPWFKIANSNSRDTIQSLKEITETVKLLISEKLHD